MPERDAQIVQSTAPPQSDNQAHPWAADLLRALAAFTVAWYHIWQQSWVGGGALDYWVRSGSVWVDTLVLLSAFCLFLPYANAWGSGQDKEIRPAAFYRRRALRIVPGYYISLAASVLVVLARPGGVNPKALALDVLAHLTFTQMFFEATYLGSALNGVTWTLTVFALFYLLFPLLVWLLRRQPVLTAAALFGVQFFYTRWALGFYGTGRYNFLFNQFPAMCGVLGLGLLAAYAFAALGRCKVLQKLPLRIGCIALGLAALWGITRYLHAQSSAAEFSQFQLSARIGFAALTALLLVALSLGLRPPKPLRKLLKILCDISFNLYLWHQMLCLWLKNDLHLPAWSGDTPPNQLGDTGWMHRANLLYWAAALAAAFFFTYAMERPLVRCLENRLQKPPANAGERAALP